MNQERKIRVKAEEFWTWNISPPRRQGVLADALKKLTLVWPYYLYDQISCINTLEPVLNILVANDHPFLRTSSGFSKDLFVSLMYYNVARVRKDMQKPANRKNYFEKKCRLQQPSPTKSFSSTKTYSFRGMPIVWPARTLFFKFHIRKIN